MSDRVHGRLESSPAGKHYRSRRSCGARKSRVGALRDSEILFRFLPWNAAAAKEMWSRNRLILGDEIPDWCVKIESMCRVGQVEESLDYLRSLSLDPDEEILREMIYAWGHIALGRNHECRVSLNRIENQYDYAKGTEYLSLMNDANRIMEAASLDHQPEHSDLRALKSELYRTYKSSAADVIDYVSRVYKSDPPLDLSFGLRFVRNRLVGSTMIFQINREEKQYCMKFVISSAGYKLYTELEEASILGSLSGLFPKLHFSEITETKSCIVMDWLNGEQIGPGKAGTPIAAQFRSKLARESEFLRLEKDLETALSELSTKGIHYSDLWPDNILMVDGRYTIIDFGYCRRMSPEEAAVRNRSSLERLCRHIKSFLPAHERTGNQ